MTVTKAGQRWMYQDSMFKFLLEIISINPFSHKLLQSFTKQSAYKVGEIHYWANDISNHWTYLEGQDKPL
jgi:hypothetical protein